MKITVILYKFNTLANGEHPITLRLAHKKERSLVSLGISSPIELWDLKNKTPKRHHPNKELIDTIIAQEIHTYRTKLLELVNQKREVTPQILIQAVKTATDKEEVNKVFPFFDQIIDRLIQADEVDNANVYKDTKHSLKLFTSSTNLLFTDIDLSFLRNYEVYLRELGPTERSIPVYFNTLRTLFDMAIEENLINPDTYPFKEFKSASAVFPFFDQVIDRLLQANDVGNANIYKDAKRALQRFSTTIDLLFIDIDQTFLHNYEIHLRKLGLAETTMSLYFRTLRALFNMAIEEDLINLDAYPFKKFKVAKFNTATKKRAINKEELKKIENLELDSASSLAETRHYFLFSYYGQGINFIDIAQLQWKNIVQDRIFYTRSKTGKNIQFKLLPPAKAIIEHYRPLTGDHPENYIFPILNRLKHITALQIDYRVENVIRKVNKELKEIARLAQIDANLTTYVARHTYATVLKKSNVPTAVISEALGHKSEFITQTYLKSFENEVIDLANECLL